MAEPLTRDFFEREPDVVAREVLGCVLVTGSGNDEVAVRLTETESYHGATDPASHAYRGETARNTVMFGPAGHLYLYFVYGMHWCANIVTGPPGVPYAVLLRSGDVVAGMDLALRRRPNASPGPWLASGPARLASVLGWGTTPAARAAYGTDLCTRDGVGGRLLAGAPLPPEQVAVGPRVGVAAAQADPLRFWIAGDTSVSDYRAHVRRVRSRAAGDPAT